MPESALAKLELAAARRLPTALELLLTTLRRLASGTSLQEIASPEAPQQPEILATRLAATMASIIADPACAFSDKVALRFAGLGRVSDQLHAISGFSSSDHILRAIGAGETKELHSLFQKDRQAFVKAWLVFSIDSALPIDVRTLLEAPAPLALLVTMGLIAQKPILTEAGHARREALVSMGGLLRPVPLPMTVDLLVQASAAWMLCSYAGARSKHAIKPVLNSVLRQWGESIGLSDAVLPGTRVLKARPTLLVAAEIMHANHVQYRYFGQYLRQMRQRFRLVLVTEGAEVDDHVRVLFDEVRFFRREGDTRYFNRLADDIKDIAPDMIFWLSVGMRHWGPVLANFRLAPIQFVGLGHCASTFCETVDYYFTEEGFVGDPDLLSEQLVLLPDESLIFETSPFYNPHPAVVRETANPLRVALPSNLLKLNPHFIGVLQKIRERAQRPIEFHVFPNVSGLEMAATRRLFDRLLPGSKIYPIKRYNDYIADLNGCDLNLSPFPFGGLNGVVDSFRQGIPLVTLEGPDLPARLDSMMLRRLGMPEWLIAQNEEDYIAAALRVIDDDSVRVALSHQILAMNVDKVLSGNASTPLRRDVVDAVWWMYQNHEVIKASGRKVFRAADRKVFP